MIISQALYTRRRVANIAFITLSFSAAIFGLIWLALALFTFETLRNRHRVRSTRDLESTQLAA